MSLETIEALLTERFKAPLAANCRRRIIFWQDEDQEFTTMVDELSLPMAKIVKLTGSNNFVVKKLLLHDDLEGNYLIYDPLVYPQSQDDWLLDIKHFSEIFRADALSMLMEEMHIAPSAPMRKVVRLYSRFFDNKERRQKLLRMGQAYEEPLTLQIDLLAVLADAKESTIAEILAAVLSKGLTTADNEILLRIKKFGSIDDFWQLAQRYTGYQYEGEQTLLNFAAHVLLSALAQTMAPNALKGLERFISVNHRAFCYSMVHEWRQSERQETLLTLCRTVEETLRLPERLAKQETAILLSSDIFPAIHEVILQRFFDEAAEQIVKPPLIAQVVDNRRTAGWYELFRHDYDCLDYLGKIQEFMQRQGSFHLTEAREIWRLYTETAYEMDEFYRRFQEAFGHALAEGHSLLTDSLKRAADYGEILYQKSYLNELTSCWVRAAEADWATLGYIAGIERQRDFYQQYVAPLVKKNSRVFVIISDALRYEAAAELRRYLSRNTNGEVKLEAMQGTFPTITKFGMAALLPQNTLEINDQLDILADGMTTRSLTEREKVLCATNPHSTATMYNDLLAMKSAKRRELISGKEVIYIYHNTIDAMGDKAATEPKVFEGCRDAIKELAALVRIITNDMNGTNILLTADHGFLYMRSPLAEGDKVERRILSGEIYESGRRYLLTAPEATADFLLPVNLTKEFGGMALRGYTLRDNSRIKITGGGENYVHGGISLPEMVVPVIVFKNLRADSKRYTAMTVTSLKLLSESRRITNLIFALDFFQSQPVGDKVQPCTYSVYLVDENGAIISDRQTIIADRTNDNASERVFHVRFHLKSGKYDKNDNYRLKIDNGIDLPEEIIFHIDMALADDFNW